MGLYFPDTVRPKGGPCPLRQDVPFRGPYCPIYNACRGDACPAIDVGPHGRLIDVSEKIRVQIYDDMTEDYHIAEMTIDDLLSQGWVESDAPTIIPAEEAES